MTLDEFTRIIDLYGTESEHWPRSQRAECESFLANNIEARALLNQQWQVDDLLAKLEQPNFPGLETRVLNQALPDRGRNPMDSIISWLIPGDSIGKQVWRPAIAACIPLVFGIVLGNYFSFGITAEDDDFQYWNDELAMLSLTDYTEVDF